MGQSCVHCGEDCGRSPVMHEGKPFCCHGCVTVYQILHQKDLTRYYSIEKTPGIRVEAKEWGQRFAFLDLEEIKSSLLSFSDGNVSRVTLFIPAIHCASCIWLLENLSSLQEGIIHSSVHFPRKEVSVTFRHDQVSLRQIVELLSSIHYVPEISAKRSQDEEGKKKNRALLLKIGIAGFVLMNVMLYSFSTYVPGGDLLEPEFRRFFGWLSLILSIPVVAYCSNDYYLSAWKSLRRKIISIDLPIALGITALFMQSAYEIVSDQGIGYLDSLSGLVFFLLVGKWYQGKTYQALSFERDYRSYFPVAVTRVKEGSEQIVSLKELAPGDHILIRNHELIPADGNIVKGQGSIDYSFVTGESLPVQRGEGEVVYAGGRQEGSSIELAVTKEVEQSYLTRLWNEEYRKTDYHSRLNGLINKVSRYFTLAVLSIALATGIYWYFADKEIAVFAFTSVLIIACPCALALTIPFTFGSAMRHYGRNGFYIKSAQVVEQLYHTGHIVFDKTGTITQGSEMTVEFQGDFPDNELLMMIKSVVRHSTHPLSVILFRHINGDALFDVDDFKEVAGLGIAAVVNGQKIHIGSRKFVTGKEEDEQLPETRVWVYIDGRVYGYFRFENSYRKGLEDVITDLSTSYELHLITGDNESEKLNLTRIFGSDKNLHFNQSPVDKLNFVKHLKQSGQSVLMVGDGLNDAGALLESDTGITIADDIYHFSPACDAILDAQQFSLLNRFVRFSGKCMNIVKWSFAISFLYNVVGLSFAVQGMVTPVLAAVLMPISSVSVVAFATFMVARFAKSSFLEKKAKINGDK